MSPWIGLPQYQIELIIAEPINRLNEITSSYQTVQDPNSIVLQLGLLALLFNSKNYKSNTSVIKYRMRLCQRPKFVCNIPKSLINSENTPGSLSIKHQLPASVIFFICK